ncbi:MAG: aminotransferase class I/II-fold pyridoxal phosphate-dependent enzyme [Spirochaetes bacterium]|nr:aminotransferase class I/II-fold pyridoxal phosphate-dependent enzyme [Spirochaetota bacterium]
MKLASHIERLPRSGIRDFFELVIGRDDVISLGVGEPDFTTPWHIREATIFSLERGMTMYTSNRGLLSLREEIVKYVAPITGKTYSPQTDVLVTVGVSEAFDLALRAIIEPGDEIIYHAPCYVSYSPIIAMCHGVPVTVPTYIENDFDLLAEDVKKRITKKTKAIIINYPNNPTGAAGNLDELKKIAELAVKNNILVILDEVYGELSYDTFVSVANFIPKENLLYLNGFSKAYAMTGYRLGYACGMPDIIEGMMKIHQYTMLCASIIAQEAGVEALRNGAGERETMRADYERRRNVIVSGLNDIGLDCFMPKGAFYAFPSVAKTKLTGKEFAVRLLEAENVAVVPGEAFGVEGKNNIRCCYATALSDIEKALVGMKRFVAKL